MSDFEAILALKADASGLVSGAQALDALASKGAQVESGLGKSLDAVSSKGKTAGDAIKSTGDKSKQAAAGLQQASGAAQRAANSFRQAGSAAQQASKGYGEAGGHMANLTFQMNDIAVMMAAGQNPLTMAMQQGLQITQIFQQMGTSVNPVRAIGSAIAAMVTPVNLATLGIIAAGGAIAQWFFNTGDSSKSYSDSIKELTESIDQYIEIAKLADLSTGEAAARFGTAALAVSRYALSLKGLMAMDMDQNRKGMVDKTLEQLGANFDGGPRSLANVASVADFFGKGSGVLGTGGLDLLTDKSSELNAQIMTLTGSLHEFRSATDLSNQIKYLEQAFDAAIALAEMDGSVSPAEKELTNGILEYLKALRMVQGEQKSMDEQRLVSSQEYAANERKLWEERAKFVADETEKLQSELALKQAIAAFGEDSIAVTRLRVQAERDAYQEIVNTSTGAGQLNDELMRIWDKANGVASVDMAGNISLAVDSTYGWADAMNDVAAAVNGIFSVFGQMGGTAIEATSKRMEADLLRKGATVAEARSAMARRELELKRDAAMGSGNFGTRLKASIEYNSGVLALDADEELAAARAEANLREREANKKGRKKSGGSGKRDMNAYLGDIAGIKQSTKDLLAQAEAIDKVISAGGDWERALRVIEEEQQLLNAAQKAGIALTPELQASVHGLAEAYVAAEEEMEKVREKQEQLLEDQERGADAVGDFFASFVDGSEAAKSALADLLEEMAKAQIKAGMLGLIGLAPGGKGFLGAVGTLLGGGLPKFSGGGSTGNGPRTGGLDGQGGYLAMLHPQETVVDHANGQSLGGSTAVHVTVSVDPEGQLNVKKVSQKQINQALVAYDKGLTPKVQAAMARPWDR